MVNLQSNLRKIVKEKLSLTSDTTTFHDNLNHFLGANVVQSRPSITADIFKLQAEADEELIFLARDYEHSIEDAVRVLAVRKAAARKVKKMKKMLDAGKVDTEAVEAANENFKSQNETMRRELEHFDMVMKDILTWS